jgi:hypothetical protein
LSFVALGIQSSEEIIEELKDDHELEEQDLFKVEIVLSGAESDSCPIDDEDGVREAFKEWCKEDVEEQPENVHEGGEKDFLTCELDLSGSERGEFFH